MVNRRWACGAALVIAVAGTLAGCSGSKECAAPYANIPPSVEAGDSVTLDLENLFKDCNDTGDWFIDDGPMGSVTVELIDTSGSVAATIESPVDADGKATVVLPIPADASGNFEVHAGDYAIGGIEVTPASG